MRLHTTRRSTDFPSYHFYPSSFGCFLSFVDHKPSNFLVLVFSMLFRVPKRAITRSTLFITGSQSLPCIRQPFLSIYKSFSTSAGRLRRQSDKLARNALGFDNDVSFETLKPNARYHVAFLRDSCACPRCVDPSTTQKLFETADIPESIKVKSAETNADGSITVEWENDMDGYENHFSTYPDHFFIDNSSIASRLQSTFNCKIGHRWFWDQHIVASRRSTIDYTEFVGSPAVLFSALQCLQTYGLIFLGNVPSKPDAIIEIANRIGPIRNTFYGPVWDVRSVPSAKNVAYTSSNLGFHMVTILCSDPDSVLNIIINQTPGPVIYGRSSGAANIALPKSERKGRRKSFQRYVCSRYNNETPLAPSFPFPDEIPNHISVQK